MPYFKKTQELPSNNRPCDHEECTCFGDFKAPKYRGNSKDFYWFCLEHVKDYNKKWDYYLGMNQDEIEASRLDDRTWNRPTRPLGGWHTLFDQAQASVSDLLGEKARKNGRAAGSSQLPLECQKAFQVLDLEFPCSVQDLKNHYKGLAKRYHPDHNKGDKDAEERLKGINHAYSVLKGYLRA